MLMPLLQQAAVLQASGALAHYGAPTTPQSSCLAFTAKANQSNLFRDRVSSIPRRSPVGQRAPVAKNFSTRTSNRASVLPTVAMAAATGNPESSDEDKRISVLFVCLGKALSPSHGHAQRIHYGSHVILFRSLIPSIHANATLVYHSEVHHLANSVRNKNLHGSASFYSYTRSL